MEVELLVVVVTVTVVVDSVVLIVELFVVDGTVTVAIDVDSVLHVVKLLVVSKFAGSNLSFFMSFRSKN